MQKKKWLIFLSVTLIDILLYLFAFGNEKSGFTASLFILISLPYLAYLGSNFPTKNKTFNKDSFLLPGILLVTVILYIPSLKYGFTNWDDTEYIVNNRLIRGLGLSNISDMFTLPFKGMYQPLSILSLTLDYIPAKLNPVHFHLTNLILHLVNTYLVYNIIRKLFNNSNIAIITTLLFGIHTIHTESVIWVSERKDVLYSLFFLLSIFQYLIYTESKSLKRYFFSILFFALSLLSKPQGVMLPVILILIDYLNNRKRILSIKNLINKSPFFILSLFFGLLALFLSEGQTLEISIFDRIIFGLYSYTAYIFQLIIPVNLSAIYPYPASVEAIHYFYGILTMVILVWGITIRKKNRKIIFGLIFFTLNILLLLQFIPNTYVIMADRYNYIASIGIFILAGLTYNYLILKFKNNKSILRITALIIGGFLLFSSFNRGKVWESSIKLWDDTLEKYPYSAEALNNRGHAYFIEGDYESALKDFNLAISSNPDQASAIINRGTLYLKAGYFEKAKNDLSIGLEKNPIHVNGLINRGITHINTGDTEKAMNDFNSAISIDPNATDAYINRGTLYESKSDFTKAILEYDIAINLEPKKALIYANRGLAHARSGNENKALSDLNTCIKLNPKYADAYSNRGFIYYKSGNYNNAIVDLSNAIKLNPDLAIAYMNRGNTYISKGDRNKACFDFQKAYSLGLEAAGQKINQYCR